MYARKKDSQIVHNGNKETLARAVKNWYTGHMPGLYVHTLFGDDVRGRLTGAAAALAQRHGAAFLAGLASGVWESVDDIALLRQSDRIFKPEMDAEQAKRQHDNWLRAVGRAEKWSLE